MSKNNVSGSYFTRLITLMLSIWNESTLLGGRPIDPFARVRPAGSGKTRWRDEGPRSKIRPPSDTLQDRKGQVRLHFNTAFNLPLSSSNIQLCIHAPLSVFPVATRSTLLPQPDLLLVSALKYFDFIFGGINDHHQIYRLWPMKNRP